ncbi:MAG: NAD(P)/FAD-dependent oxidoreductase [Steroidobacteraceae bacterium]
MDTVDAVVIGAGVIGLAVARSLTARGRETLILEAGDRFGAETSSRSSEVIHAGIHYSQDWLKARLCVAGRDLLYAFCERHGIEHRRCGKLIVATSPGQLPQLQKIRAAAWANGVELASLSRSEALALEPELSCAGALHSALTGIIDSHAYMLALLGEAQNRGAILVYNSKVTRMWPQTDGVLIALNGEGPTCRARLVVNCAGLCSPQVANAIEGFPREHIPHTYFAKGNYFALSGRTPFQRLVYPVPEPGGLGVHLTLDLAGRARFGPDVQWIEDCDYAVDPRRSESFYAAIRSYWPALADNALQPAYAGIRPKLSGPTQAAADFRIDGPRTHGVAGIVNLFGIESPGLTASLAIAEHVAQMM